MFPLAFAVLLALVLGTVLPFPKDAHGAAVSRAVDDALRDGDIDGDDLPVVAPGSSRTMPSHVTGHAWLSVVGFSRTADGERREIGGLVVLGLPLDRFAESPRRTVLRSGPHVARDSGVESLHGIARPTGNVARVPANAFGPQVGVAGPTSSPSPGSPNTGASSPTLGSSTSSPTGPAQASPLVTPATIVEVDGSVTVTPRLARTCVAMALKASGIGLDDQHLDSVVSRARWSAVLPEMRLRATRYDDQRLSTDTQTTDDGSRLRDSAGAELGLEARLTWRLDRLVYADDEPAFERMRLDRQEARAKVASRVLETLFQWQRAWLELRAAERERNRSPRDEADLAVRVVEKEATLDVLTGGWFSSWRGTHLEVVPPPATDEQESAADQRGDTPRSPPAKPTGAADGAVGGASSPAGAVDATVGSPPSVSSANGVKASATSGRAPPSASAPKTTAARSRTGI